jgi:hypothetical protein
MKRGNLIDANSRLQDPVQLREELIRCVAASTAIETGGSVKTIAKDLRQFLDRGMPRPKPHPRKPSRKTSRA